MTGFGLGPTTTPSLWQLAALERSIPSQFGDVRDLSAVQTAVTTARPELILHLAAQSLVRPSYQDPMATFATNIMGTAHVLEAARGAPDLRGVVVVTSDKCYENREWPHAYREGDALGGYDPYSASKGCAEVVTAAMRRSFFADGTAPALASARAGNVIGGGDFSVDRLVPDLVRAFLAGEAALLRNPAATRPWQHVLEPLHGYLRLAQRLFEGGSAYAEAWNFGPLACDEVPVQRVATELCGHFPGASLRVAQDHTAPHEAGLLRLDPGKSMLRLGWRPTLTLSEALRWIADWHHAIAVDPSAARAMTEAQIAAFEAQIDATQPAGAA